MKTNSDVYQQGNVYSNVMGDKQENFYAEPEERGKEDEKLTPEAEEPSVRSILTTFSESTTMHGVARVGSPDKGWLSRTLWLLFVLFFFGWAAYSVTFILLNFSSNPISTLVTVNYEQRQSFPAVTICNLNQLLFSQLKYNEKLKALKEQFVDDLDDFEIEDLVSLDIQPLAMDSGLDPSERLINSTLSANASSLSGGGPANPRPPAAAAVASEAETLAGGGGGGDPSARNHSSGSRNRQARDIHVYSFSFESSNSAPETLSTQTPATATSPASPSSSSGSTTNASVVFSSSTAAGSSSDTASGGSAATSTDSALTATDSVATVTNSSTTAIDASAAATESSTTATDASAAATESSTTATDSSAAATESSTTATDSSAAATESSTTGTESSAAATESSTTATDSSAAATESSTTGTESSAAATESSTTATESSAAAAAESSTTGTSSSTGATDSSTTSTTAADADASTFAFTSSTSESASSTTESSASTSESTSTTSASTSLPSSSSAVPSTTTTTSMPSTTEKVDALWFEDPDYWESYSDYHWHDSDSDSDSVVQAPPQADMIEESEQSKANIRSFMDRLSPLERFEFGHHMFMMLLDCRYQTQGSCSYRNFTRFYNHYFGNCYTFNKDESVASVSKSGPLYGMTLLLNVQSEEYIKQSDTVGFKVLIHPQDSMPFPEDEGIIISPGFATNIAIKKQDFRRSPPPYENCKYYSEQENRQFNMYALPPYKVHYTEKACQRTCYQRKVVLTCDCCDGDYPCMEHSPAIPGDNVTFCHTFLQLLCAKRVHAALENSKLGCVEECIPNCAETTYSGEVSMGVWPTRYSVKELKKKFRNNPSLANFTELADFRENVAKLNIYFKHLNYEKFETFPSYDWYRLLSDLGGQMGLWLGISLLTAVEFVELACQVVAHACRTMHQTGRSLVTNGKNKPAHV